MTYDFKIILMGDDFNDCDDLDDLDDFDSFDDFIKLWTLSFKRN